MKIRKVIAENVNHEDKDVNAAGGLNAVVSASVNEQGANRSRVSSRQRIVQRNGRTEVFESSHTFEDERDTKSKDEGESR